MSNDAEQAIPDPGRERTITMTNAPPKKTLSQEIAEIRAENTRLVQANFRLARKFKIDRAAGPKEIVEQMIAVNESRAKALRVAKWLMNFAALSAEEQTGRRNALVVKAQKQKDKAMRASLSPVGPDDAAEE